MSRGTECTVPIMPGLVIDAVVPAKSSGEILLPRTFTMRSSYARQNPAKSRVSASFTLGTSSECVPSRFCTSTARPRFTCWWRTTTGLPSSVAYAELSPGKSASARSTAYAMRWVKLTLPGAGARELVVEDLAVDLEQLGRDDAHRGGRGDGEARLHVLDRAGGGAAQRLRLVAVEHQRTRSGRGRSGCGDRRSGCCRRGCRVRAGAGGAGAEPPLAGAGWPSKYSRQWASTAAGFSR